MQRFVAFLRAINVGGHVVKMDALRRLFEEIGLSDVETFIASGNVVFSASSDAPALEEQIEARLHDALGYKVAAFVRSAPELAAIAAHRPFPIPEPAADAASLYIGFLHAPPSAEAQQKLTAFRTPLDDFQIHDREIYLLCPQRFSEAAFSGALLEKTLRLPTTLRNVTTVQKLAAKYPAP